VTGRQKAAIRNSEAYQIGTHNRLLSIWLLAEHLDLWHPCDAGEALQGVKSSSGEGDVT